MKDHTDCVRAFSQASRAWYSKAILAHGDIDSITFGFYHKEGGTTGEMTMEWIRLGGRMTPKLTVFDDAWNALNEFKDLLIQMAEVDSLDVSPEVFRQMLLACGFEDRTQTIEVRERDE